MDKIKGIILFLFMVFVSFPAMGGGKFVEVKTPAQNVKIYVDCGGRIWSWKVENRELVKRNFSKSDKAGLFADRFWRPNNLNREIDRNPYQLLYKKESANVVEVCLSHNYKEIGIKGLFLKKTYFISKNKPEIKITYSFENKGKYEIGFSLWCHSMPEIGEEPGFFIPTEKGMIKTSKEDGRDIIFPTKGAEEDDAYWGINKKGVISEGWVIESSNNRNIVADLELNKISQLYLCQVEPPTLEWMYKMVYLKPGQRWNTSIKLAYHSGDVEKIIKEKSVLIGYWSFDEGEGNIAKDNSPLKNDGKIYNCTWVEGKVGSALHFSGRKSYVVLPYKEVMPDEFTMMAWIYLKDIKKYNGIFSRWDYLKGERSFDLYVCKGGGINYCTSSSGIRAGRCAGSHVSIEPNKWYHIAVGQRGRVAKIFINGEEAGSNVVDKLFPNKRSIIVGVQSDIHSNFFKGIIDEVRIYKKALSSKEICQIAGIPLVKIPEGPLVSYFPLDEGKGKVRDKIGKLKGRVSGGRWIGKNLLLDGLESYIVIPSKDYLNFKDEFSISCWVYPKRLIGRQVFVSKGEDVVASPGWYTYGYNFLQKDGKLGFRAFVDKKVNNRFRKIYEVYTDSKVLKENRWQFVAITYSVEKRKLKLFLDGKKIKETSIEWPILYDGNSLPLVIGANASQRQNWELLGFIKEVKLYNTALSEEEIEKDYLKSQQITNIKIERTRPEIKAKIIDSDTKKPINARVIIKGSDGKNYFPIGGFVYGNRNSNWFYAFGEFSLEVPEGETEITVLHGPEYEVKEIKLNLEGRETKELNIALKRLVNMQKKGWYCGDHEVQYVGHSRGYGKYDDLYHGERGSFNIARVCQAEGLNWVVYSRGAWGDKKWEDTPAVPGKFIQIVGAEPPTWLDDDIICIGIERNIEWERGTRNRVFQWQLLGALAERGGIGISAHPYIGNFWSVSNKEFSRCFPIYVALKRKGFAPILNSRLSRRENEGYYHFLNLGFKLGLSGSTDSYIGNPNRCIVGSSRTWVKLKELTRPEIMKSLLSTASFCSNGPIVFFTLAGREIGDIVKLTGDKKEKLPLHLESYFFPGIEKIEVIKNGKVIKTINGEGRKKIIEDFPIEINETCWIAVRCQGKRNKYFGINAHTSPVYVQFGEEGLKIHKEDIDYFVKWLDDLEVFVEKFKKAFPQRVKGNEKHFKKLDELIKEAKQVYLSLNKKKRKWDN